MKIPHEAIPQHKKGFMLQEMDGEMLLYHTAEVTTTYLNPSAVVIWQLCDGQLTVQAIIDELAQRFPDAADLSQDVVTTLQDFISRDLVELTWLNSDE